MYLKWNNKIITHISSPSGFSMSGQVWISAVVCCRRNGTAMTGVAARELILTLVSGTMPFFKEHMSKHPKLSCVWMLKALVHLLTHLDQTWSFQEVPSLRAAKVHRFRWIKKPGGGRGVGFVLSSFLKANLNWGPGSLLSIFSKVTFLVCVIIMVSTGFDCTETNERVHSKGTKNITRPSSLYSVIDIQLQGIKRSYI